MTAKSAQEIETFIGSLSALPPDRIKVSWGSTVTSAPTVWKGTVLSVAGDKKSAKVRYEGKGDVPFDLPHVGVVYFDLTREAKPADAPSMIEVQRLLAIAPFNAFDIGTWGQYNTTTVNQGVLMDRLKDHFRCNWEPITKDEYVRARQLHLYEKQFIMDILERWLGEHFGQTDLMAMPACLVADACLHRLHAFEENETNGTPVSAMMQAWRRTKLPKGFADVVKDAKKIVSSKNEVDE